MSSYICYEDYLDTATRTASSYNANFPDSNLYDQSNRGKVWRSSGTFVVTSSNNGIRAVNNATTATASIAAGTYTAATLCTAIAAALVTALGNTYTVTYSTSTYKFTIARASGSGVFQLLWTNVASTAYDLLGYSNASDDTGATTYTGDNVRLHSEEYLHFDLGVASNPKVFIAIGKKNQAIKLSESATITLEANLTDSFTSPAFTQSLSYDERAILAFDADGLATTSYRYWRLKIVDKENANGYLELSNLYLGNAYIPTTGKPLMPFSVQGEDYSSATQFVYGGRSFNRQSRGESFSFSWFPLTVSEKETFDDLMANVGNSKPFYCIFDPNSYIGSSVNYNCRFVRFSQPFSLTLELPNMWRSSWSLQEVI